MPEELPVVIVGAGVSGLACAQDLQKAGVPFLLLEQSDAVGGRVRSDEVDGFRLDRGFQVWLEAYPECNKRLDRSVLKPGAFESGAILYDGSALKRFPDPLRHPSLALEGLRHPVGSLGDKLRLQKLRTRLAKQSSDQLFAGEEENTLARWQRLGFSQSMIEGFLTPFFRGIFLAEPEEVSSRMFDFVFSMFGQGCALLPQNGMQAIPEFLASTLPADCLRLNCGVAEVHANRVVTTRSQRIDAAAVVVAVEQPQTLGVSGEAGPVESLSVTNLYFDAASAPFEGGWLVLNGSGKGRVNQVSVNSNVVGGLAPEGRHLVSVSLQGLAEDGTEELVATVRSELTEWFGEEANNWRFLKEYRIQHALPVFAPGQLPGPGVREVGGLLVCGDGSTHPSLQGAMASGAAAAEAACGMLGR